MRYTIEGFSQTEAVKFRRIEIVKDSKGNDKEKVVTLDCTDLVILRWFVDFWPNMMKVEIGGRQYAWLSYKSAIEDMPILGVKKGMFALRLKKLVDFGILSHETVKSGGTFSYYGFGPQYARLVDSKRAQDTGDSAQNISDPLPKKLDTPTQNFSDQIDPNTKDPSTKQPKERKKPTETYDSIIDGFTQDQELRDALRGFLQYRVATAHRQKKEFTNHALKLNLSKLRKLSSDPMTMTAIVDQTVEKGWLGFYELKDVTANQDHMRNKAKPSEPTIGTVRYDNTTGRSEVYRGNGVWEAHMDEREDEECPF